MARSMFWKCAINLLLVVCTVFTERTKDKMYDIINATAYCFKRLNATHQFGCSSSRSGDIGVIHVIERMEDIDWLIDKADAGPYIPVVDPTIFNLTKNLSESLSEKISGMVLIPSVANISSFSTEDQCPNRYSSYDTEQCKVNWNPYGNGLIFHDWGFPVIYIDSEEDIKKIKDCFHKHNAKDRDTQSQRSLCSLEITCHMLAAVDSRTCIRRSNMLTNLTPIRYCDPLGDRNIFSTLFPRIKRNGDSKPRPIIMLLSRLDGTSMFDGLVPGAMSPVTGLVTLLSTAYLLTTMVNAQANVADHNIMFGLLNGESYDYIGSSRLIYDIENNVFPHRPQPDARIQSPLLSLEDIGLVIELDQITQKELYFHVDCSRINNTVNLLPSFLNITEEEGLRSMEICANTNATLPPSSLQNFLKANRESQGVIISNYEKEYINRYYHSIFDNAENIDYTYANGSVIEENSIQDVIANVSIKLARSLYKLTMKEKYDGESHKNEVLRKVDELLHCYIDTMNCTIFNQVTYKQVLLDKPAPLYVGVNVYNNSVTTFTGQTLAYFTGSVAYDRNETTCYNDPDNLVFQYIWMNGESTPEEKGVCMKSTMHYSSAVSPAFEIEGYDWLSGQYSTWTESIWREFSSRMFLRPSKSHETLTISLGASVLILSFIIVYFANSRATILFNSNVLGSGGC